jgi:glucose-6-phosphate 1-dehydrogenase
VPFELESGKALNRSYVAIEVDFKGDPMNALTFIIQPHEGIRLRFNFKRPGFGNELEARDLSFAYADEPANAPVRDAYERVLYDCIRGDQSLFISTPEIVEEWRITAAIITAWQGSPLRSYPVGGSNNLTNSK